MLLGAALVVIGVLTTALADHIRGLRHQSRMTAPGCGHTWDQDVNAARNLLHHVTRKTIPQSPTVLESTTTMRSNPVKPRVTPPAIKPQNWPRDAVDLPADMEVVVTALICAGYKKQIANEAACACSAVERTTVENWTRAALRRCVVQAS